MESKSPLQVDFGDVFGGAASGAAAGAALGPAGAIGGAIVGGIGGYFSGKANDELEAQQQEQRDAFNKKLEQFASKPIENPFANMTNQFAGLKNEMADISTDNKFEDLTVNLKSADYQKQMAQESEAQVMKAAKAGAGGAGGVAAIANMMAKQNARIRQQIGADIGQQEAQNQKLAAQGAESARQMQSQIAQEGNRINQVIAQGQQQIDMAQSGAQMDINQMQENRDQMLLGFQADQLSASLGTSQAQMQGNEDMLFGGLDALGSVASAFDPNKPAPTGGTVINVNP